MVSKPKTAVPFWGGLILLLSFSIINFINYRKKSKEAQELREAEIARQQAEMEDAREFQQGMLPSEMPKTDDYEMVGFQQTATEVGGDFFDFMQKKDGKWIAICGDATGHGLTSGNVVSITKTAMNSLVEEDPVSTLDSLNKTLLKMNIGLNRMCLNIANIQDDVIQFSSAGMPPAYLYSSEKGEIEEVLVASIVLESHILSRESNIFDLISKFSVAASITKSISTNSFRSFDVDILFKQLFICSVLIFSAFSCLDKLILIESIALVIASLSISCKVTL